MTTIKKNKNKKIKNLVLCDLDPLLCTCSIAVSQTSLINWRLLRHIFTTPVIYNCVKSNL